MDVFEAIAGRRSIKPQLMRADPVDRALLDRLFEAANWAPSHGHTEPWRFIVFEGEARRALARAVLSTMVEEGEDPIPDSDPRAVATMEKMLNPPVIIAILCHPSTGPKVIEHEELCSVAMAVQNLHLAARALGLGGFWSSGKKAFDPRMAAFLGIQPPARCLGFFYVGWPHAGWPEGRRRPYQDKVEYRS